ncbi:MAG: DUF502 domain-containing protein [Parachlamydiaceae bacterium]|nr:DUF502 domain-containing protein [Parachlamydiaceae bacterium]
MKKYLITGLIILLPLALTIFVIKFFFNILTDPFVGGVKSALNYFGLFNSGSFLVNSEEIQLIISKLLILIFLFAFTVLLGFLTSWFLIRYLIKIWDYILHRIPIVRTIYKGSQDVINTIFSDRNQSFKQVVMVPYPHLNAYSIGFVTRDDLPPINNPNGPTLSTVFIPTTPNPTSGFLVIYEKKDLIYLDMKVEEAFKYIISCGVISKNFTLTSQAVDLHDNT